MAGNIAKRPDGRWRARYRDESGKEHARHFGRKVDAQHWLDEQTSRLLMGTHVAPKHAKITVGQWCDTWLDGYRAQPRLHRPAGRDPHQADQGSIRHDAARVGASLACADLDSAARGRGVGGLLRLRPPLPARAGLLRRRSRRAGGQVTVLEADVAGGRQAAALRLHRRADVGVA